MHRLTNADADRLAADLDDAGTMLHHLAAWHARYASGLAAVGEWRGSQLHSRASESARDRAHDMQDYATRLRDREPLWSEHKRPEQDRARAPRAIAPSKRRSA